MAATEEKSVSQEQVALLKIPAFPPVAIRVLHLLSDDDVSVNQLLELVRADPAFSAELLRRANSPLFGFSSQIASVQHALVVLGFRRIRGLALTVATGMYLKKAMQVEELRKFWRYSLACALLSEEMARACSLPEDIAYTAGLLHDVGRLGLMVAFPTEYARLIQISNQKLEAGEPFDLLENERNLFGIDHYEAGTMLAEKWNLPAEFREIAGRHTEKESGQFDLVGLVRVGCQIANALGFGLMHNPDYPTLERILAELPAGVRNRLPAEPNLLKEDIGHKIASLDIAGVGLPGLPSERESGDGEKLRFVAARQSSSDEPGETGPPETTEGTAERQGRTIHTSDILIFLLATVVFTVLILFALYGLFPL